MKNQKIIGTQDELEKLKATTISALEACASYPETTRFLHRELQRFLQIHDSNPNALKDDAAIRECVQTLIAALKLLSFQVEQMHAEGIVKAKQTIDLVRKDISEHSSTYGADLSLNINLELQECEKNLYKISQELEQFRNYINYHSRALKAISLD